MEDISREEKKVKKKDYYKILGLHTKQATSEEIRKHYRKLAGKWHPDKNRESEETREYAEKMFKDINEAYLVLSDERKRQIYDAGGNPDDIGTTNTNPSNFEDMFKEHFGYKYNNDTKGNDGSKHSHSDSKKHHKTKEKEKDRNKYSNPKKQHK
jgi:DnaJ-class molecular chaperone